MTSKLNRVGIKIPVIFKIFTIMSESTKNIDIPEEKVMNKIYVVGI